MSKLKKALEKAKASRGGDLYTSIGEMEGLAAVGQRGRAAVTDRCEIEVCYSRTKVEPVDLKTLRKNKIISLFQEDGITDQIKTLRTQILMKLREVGGNTILVTSANPSEGKTFTAINLGVSIAQELDRTVLIVDADLRNPSVHHYDFANDFFGIHISEGLAHYLMGQVEVADILLNPGIEKLTILPGGRPLPNSAEVLGSPRMESLIKEMKSRYRSDRVIIFDSPAILVCPDPLVLASFVDGILLVVEEERTTAADLKRCMELLKDRLILGAVLNKSQN